MNSVVKLKDLKFEQLKPVESDSTLDQFVRLLSRSIVTAAAFDQAMIEYCREYFDEANVDDLVLRHQVCSKLRGPVAFSALLAVFLDSPDFTGSIEKSVRRKSDLLHGDIEANSPRTYAKLLEGLHAPTEKEEQFGNTANALNQQMRLIARSAQEVGLVDYLYVSRVKTQICATKKLSEFFATRLAEKLSFNDANSFPSF